MEAIPVDGRPHLDGRLQIWNGDSRGHWEDDTLVIDTTNFSAKSDFMGSHENLRLTEKIRRAGPDILNYEFTVNDPTTWTAPWTAMRPRPRAARKSVSAFSSAVSASPPARSRHAEDQNVGLAPVTLHDLDAVAHQIVAPGGSEVAGVE